MEDDFVGDRTEPMNYLLWPVRGAIRLIAF